MRKELSWTEESAASVTEADAGPGLHVGSPAPPARAAAAERRVETTAWLEPQPVSACGLPVYGFCRMRWKVRVPGRTLAPRGSGSSGVRLRAATWGELCLRPSSRVHSPVSQMWERGSIEVRPLACGLIAREWQWQEQGYYKWPQCLSREGVFSVPLGLAALPSCQDVRCACVPSLRRGHMEMRPSPCTSPTYHRALPEVMLVTSLSCLPVNHVPQACSL